DFLQNSATVQLVSKNSGHLLQVLMSPNGILTFDGNGVANGFNSKNFENFIVKIL
ncbi:unnamed protein product, partial [Rotaria socialis]